MSLAGIPEMQEKCEEALQQIEEAVKKSEKERK